MNMCEEVLSLAVLYSLSNFDSKKSKDKINNSKINKLKNVPFKKSIESRFC